LPNGWIPQRPRLVSGLWTMSGLCLISVHCPPSVGVLFTNLLCGSREKTIRKSEVCRSSSLFPITSTVYNKPRERFSAAHRQSRPAKDDFINLPQSTCFSRMLPPDGPSPMLLCISMASKDSHYRTVQRRGCRAAEPTSLSSFYCARLPDT
jgi:hypothetical protein